MDALKVSEAKMVVYLHPSKTKVVSESIKRELSSHLFKFNDTFDGVLLAYEVVEVPSKLAKILSGLDPYLAVRLKANLLLFAPKPDTFLEPVRLGTGHLAGPENALACAGYRAGKNRLQAYNQSTGGNCGRTGIFQLDVRKEPFSSNSWRACCKTWLPLVFQIYLRAQLLSSP